MKIVTTIETRLSNVFLYGSSRNRVVQKFLSTNFSVLYAFISVSCPIKCLENAQVSIFFLSPYVYINIYIFIYFSVLQLGKGNGSHISNFHSSLYNSNSHPSHPKTHTYLYLNSKHTQIFPFISNTKNQYVSLFSLTYLHYSIFGFIYIIIYLCLAYNQFNSYICFFQKT